MNLRLSERCCWLNPKAFVWRLQCPYNQLISHINSNFLLHNQMDILIRIQNYQWQWCLKNTLVTKSLKKANGMIRFMHFFTEKYFYKSSNLIVSRNLFLSKISSGMRLKIFLRLMERSLRSFSTSSLLRIWRSVIKEITLIKSTENTNTLQKTRPSILIP